MKAAKRKKEHQRSTRRTTENATIIMSQKPTQSKSNTFNSSVLEDSKYLKQNLMGNKIMSSPKMQRGSNSNRDRGVLYQNDYSSTFTLVDCLSNQQNQVQDDHLISTNIDIPPGNLPILPGEEDDRTCLTIDNVLSAKECTKIIQRSEEAKFQRALVNIGVGEILDADYRNSDRCIIDDADFARVIFKRIESLLPSILPGATAGRSSNVNWKLSGLNERMRILRYSQGHFFAEHRDGYYAKNVNERSFMTIMIYLNSEFKGGSTILPSRGDVASGVGNVEILPQCGRVFVFDHILKHEGAEVISGVKYAIRTDVMYKVEEAERY